MHQNYENAKVTLIHDRFLRGLEWVDAETACLAVAMSPWFSRGWTALELAKSHTVKVLIKEKDGLTLKDLDEDILSLRGFPSERHKILANAIQQLRDEKITDLDRLLTVLGPRHTSWSRDITVIAGLLVGVPVGSAVGSTAQVYQQDIHQSILRKLSVIRHGHLFHNSPTIHDGVSWCPISLFDLQLASVRSGSDRFLEIESNGELVGVWNVAWLGSFEDKYHIWTGVHPLIEARLRSSLKQKRDHFFLIEPELTLVDRALLVRKRRQETVQVIGCMYFHPPQELQEGVQGGMIRIINMEKTDQTPPTDAQAVQPYYLGAVVHNAITRTEGCLDSTRPSWKSDERPAKVHAANIAQAAAERGFVDLEHDPENNLMKELRRWKAAGGSLSGRDADGRTLLSRAAEEGNYEVVSYLLQRFEECLTINGEALARVRNKPTAAQLLQLLDSKDAESMTPLSWAAQNGHQDVVQKLLLWIEVDINSTSSPYDISTLPMVRDPQSISGDRATPLFLAAENGHTRVIELLLDAGADIHGAEGSRRREYPLHAASAGGHLETIDLLLMAGADVDAVGSYTQQAHGTALHLAIRNRNDKVVQLLLSRGAKLEVPPFGTGIGSFNLALHKGYIDIVKMIVGADTGQEPWLDEALAQASGQGAFEVVELLLDRGANVNAQVAWPGNALLAASKSKWEETMVWSTVDNAPKVHAGNTFKTVELLLKNGAQVNARYEKDGTALHAASAKGSAHIVDLLLKHGADVNAKGGPHGTALEAAKHFGHKEVVKLLQSNGASRFNLG